jgi:trk system potassium uptake protein TrkA
VPGALEIQRVAGGRLELFRFAVAKGAVAVDKALAGLEMPDGTRLVHLRRGDEFVVPHGGTRLQAGDKVIAMGLPGRLVRLGAVFHGQRKVRREAVVVGGGRVGRSVTRGLMRSGWSVKVVEIDRERCDVVAARTEALVLHGDGTDVEFLEQEQLADAPVVVAVTNSDERNLLVALVIKQLGNARVITRADRLSNERLFEKVGVDVVRSAKGAAIRTIVASIDPYESEIHAELEHGTACVMEITVAAGNPPVPLSRIRPPAYAVVGAILRGPETLIPSGQDELLPLDHLFVFCARSDEEELRHYFERPVAV